MRPIEYNDCVIDCGAPDNWWIPLVAFVVLLVVIHIHDKYYDNR
jgi:hypothetical protein